jgi:hypothetical protein
MPHNLYLQEAIKFELQAFRRSANPRELKERHVAFSGSPRKHPYDRDKVILVADPVSTNTFYYEFRRDDIAFVEELPNIVNVDDETIPMVRIWVRKHSIAVRCLPFWVDDTTQPPS